MVAPQQHDEDAEAVEFQLPLLGLYADLEIGRGSVQLPDEFGQAPREVQLAVLDDWLRSLTCLKQAVVERLGREPQD